MLCVGENGKESARDLKLSGALAALNWSPLTLRPSRRSVA
jgi:hypothetical protein